MEKERNMILKKKLNMIIYNKECQKMVLVNLKDYKKLSGKYKIGKKMEKEKNIILKVN